MLGDHLLGFDEMDLWDLVRNHWELRFQQFEGSDRSFAHCCRHGGDHIAQHCHDVVVVVDVAELSVQAGVFGEVPAVSCGSARKTGPVS